MDSSRWTSAPITGGKVEFRKPRSRILEDEAEVRTDFSASVPFVELEEVIAERHPYEVPMIIAEAPKELLEGHSPAARYLRGVFEVPEGSKHLAVQAAHKLVAKHFAACVQMEDVKSNSKTRVALKTTIDNRDQIARKVYAAVGQVINIAWAPIHGNQAYLDWLEKTVSVSAQGTASGDSSTGSTPAEL